MFIESLNPVISPESIGKLKNEPFIARLRDFKVAFVQKGIYWEAEKPLIDQSPLATELTVTNRYKATLAVVLQKRCNKIINKADFDLYKPLAKEIQTLADGMGFNSKNPDINIVTFIECCLDQAGLPEVEIQTGKQETQLVKLTQDHLDRLDPGKHPETANQLREQFKKKKKGSWRNEVAKIITSDRALREFLVTNRRIAPLLIYELETLLDKPLTVTEMKDVRRVAQALIKLADHCQLYSSETDLDLLGFVQTARRKVGYTSKEYETTLTQSGSGPSPSIRISENRQSRIRWKLLPIPIAIGILGIISYLQGVPMFQSQQQPPLEPTTIIAPLPTSYPKIPSPVLPTSRYQDSDTIVKPQTIPPPVPTKSPLPIEESDKPPRLNVIEKSTSDWIFNPVYSFIKKVNAGKEIPSNRQNTLAIALAAKGSENYPSAIIPGKMEWHTDVNTLLFVTADPISKKVYLDFVTPFTRDQLSTNTINGGNPKIKLVASLIGKDAYRKEMSAVAGQPSDLLLVERDSFAKALDYIFPKGVTINIPVAFNGFKVGKQQIKGESLYSYLAERMSFTAEKGYPVLDQNIQVTDNVARLQKGLDVMKDIIKNFKDDPWAVLRLKDSMKYLDIDPKLKTAIDEFDLLGNGIGSIIGFLKNPKQSDFVTIRFHSTLDLDVPSQYFKYLGTEDQYLDIVSPDPLSAGAQKHFQPITSAIDKIIAGK